MDNIYLFMLVAITVLAVFDIIVGVSNDAINFLNSAIGSKALPMRTIMIVASLGIFIGAVFSSGMMEVARKGIFVPGQFEFGEIMLIFMAVMITDILLLDFFNTLGLPTSTTVSIVFNLLGAAVVMSLIKISGSDAQTLADLGNYINTKKATEIISGILLSVVIAFSVGALVQWVSRAIFTFNIENKMKHFGAFFGGVALTAITYFIFLKGLKGTPYYNDLKGLLEGNEIYIILGSFAFWTLFSFIFEKLTKKTVLLVVIAIGTFGLALAFSGNDLVNFIGVPMAAYHSYEAWTAGGMDSAMSMAVLEKKVPAEPLLLFISGAIMVITLWFSKKAKTVAETEISLSRQSDTHEKFEPNAISRAVVKGSTQLSNYFSVLIPNSIQHMIGKSFHKPNFTLTKDQSMDAPAFDMIRASVNLMVAGVLIAIATSMKLPLSTTYVTFMVAMGTSLADRAWGRESAVYRVAGVLNVIGGWFGTAIGAFIAAGFVVFLINWNSEVMIPILLLLTGILLYRNYRSHKDKSVKKVDEDSLTTAEISSVQGVIHESAKNISKVVKRTNRIYSNAIVGLAKQDLTLLKKSKKQVVKLSEEIDVLRDNIFYFIKNLDESSVEASNFYINILGYLQDMAQSLELISKVSYKHINNNHKKLKLSQIKELKEIDDKLETLFADTENTFKSGTFEQISPIISEKKVVYALVKEKIKEQVKRTRSEESSPKNTTLYFSILLETKDLINSTMNLLEEYYEAHDGSVEPATLEE
ncbi:MAG: inorganic phosphate transporter [Bacteroidia bacterium]|nr:inorganic phosphate transporter [Bacteroidia bacterium]NND24442.1 inorganic phosphate transporter [Flavobacteriaceae bacterium]MBT8279088.1 inorganic phosphate transporter [Bacteroidia bacterium]NNK60438.1 inorganic phosphate transporter [Flavobacteriaceae bacterium]NNL32323.1 inorganic phosphate transporter [Flavobacteriaceae bacterium]